MKCSYNWLKEYVRLDGVTPKELAHALTMSGSKVETVTELGADIQNVVIGKVLAIEKHPDADRLFVCSVDVGDGTPRQIVTGADNVFAGAVIPAALDEALLPGGKKIKTGKMRGLESQGMLCSGDELGLDGHDQPDSDADGILILDDSFAVGTDAVEALMLRDTVLEFEITNNRPDCLSVIGLAREAAATLRLPFNGQTDAPRDPLQGEITQVLTVTVENDALCPRYSARVVKDITIGLSPLWMRRRLRACGVRPINNIVDITNYVMLETGQPMHAFDYAYIQDKQIVVRAARAGETLKTLDEKERALEPSMLVIADANNAVALAGVMGGAGSEITEKTRTIVFESANFNGPSVRKTALSLSMRTDSSSRFEKGLDPAMAPAAMERACKLIEELNAGTVLSGTADVQAGPTPPVTVPFTREQIEKHLGVAIPDVNELLESLGFTVKDGAVVVPSWRRDVSIWQDLAEEAARLHGYDNIPATLPPSKNQGWLTEPQKLRAQLHGLCVSLGFYEMLTYSFIGPADLDAARLTADKAKVIQNPLGEEHSIMRTALLPSFIEALSHNAAVRNPEARLYELNMIYTDEGGRLPLETRRLILGGYGGGMDFLALKGVVETLLGRFCRKEAVFARAEEPSLHPGRSASVSIGGRVLGVLGELHPSLGFPPHAAVCELDAEALIELARPDAVFASLPRFPAISRDLALICKKETPAAEIVAIICKAGGALLEDCVLFDVYEGRSIPEDSRSLAYRLTFRAPDRTLRDDEAEAAVAKILKKLQDGLGVIIRS
ncbi:MAG: phenylalanine--tRNA ligase subunit beta [Oscillospiraceae bacterium]|jgi:phenylalanyl-tRNA synthetase beta chain|nr:phenylalanine--tRNA ligase subunit beta [Oscillospiraceae bacterium]